MFYLLRRYRGESSVEYAMMIMLLVTGLAGWLNTFNGCFAWRIKQAANRITTTASNQRTVQAWSQNGSVQPVHINPNQVQQMQQSP